MSRVWMDQGGTFTDVIRVDEHDTMRIEKHWSDQISLEAVGADASQVRRGSTVATNALLEGTGVPVLLLTNDGFADMAWIGEQARPDLFSLQITRPKSLCAGVVEVGGRIDAAGHVLAPLRVDAGELMEWVDRGVRSAAIVLIHGPRHPDTERQLAQICRDAGFTQVSVGHEVAPSRGYLSRLHTTLTDAALSPLLPRAPGMYMRSDGGLSQASEWRGANAILSGPAGGAVATAALAVVAEVGPSIGFDMGGTSTDVCRVDGEPERTDHLDIAGMRLRVPALDIETVAAGGGSILSMSDGLISVGPRSAGADPGPAVYGRGGPATLTDADAVLGRLPGFPAVCGPRRDQPLFLEAATSALSELCPELNIEEAAAGFRRVAAETAAGAIRTLAAARGVDPAAHALVAFGGAGPGHACEVARALGIRTVLVPELAGVFSALGIGAARRRAEVVVPVHGSIHEAVVTAKEQLPFEGEQEWVIAARHEGTQHILEVPLLDTSPPDGPELSPPLLERFAEQHRLRCGFDRPNQAVQAVEIRARVEAPIDGPLEFKTQNAAGEHGVTRAWFDGWKEVPHAPMMAADGVEGPALLSGQGCVVCVDPGWRVEVGAGFIRLQDIDPPDNPVSTSFHPVHTAVMGARIMGIAQQMGERLARLARSVSIRERRDFSCAVFDASGHLIANAPHIPVHLGAMGETVRDLISRKGETLAPGQAWACNDPYAGGSHLPDITVIRPIFFADQPIAFVAARGHHVDVGGLTPGSMPPAATHIDEEGFVLSHVCIANENGFTPPPLPGCREPEVVLADLEAQVAACAAGNTGLLDLIDSVGASAFSAQMAHLMGQAARAVSALLRRRQGVHKGEEILDDGTRIQVEFTVTSDTARLEIRAPKHPGNLNAPTAVARAALLYVFRCLIDEPLALLNEGSLRPFTIHIEPETLFSPVHPAAVAGGNVETSQRLVDALLIALGAQAASQGTMNNLTVGTRQGAWYETIGGGSGAGPGFAGADGVQVHMTNTRATDVEELEARFPVRLDSLTRREGSGGEGQWRGGDGVVKTWTFLDHAEVALLAQRRVAGSPGANGGRPGVPGRDLRDVGGGWEPAPTQWTAKAGDRLQIQTPGGGGYGSIGDS